MGKKQPRSLCVTNHLLALGPPFWITAPRVLKDSKKLKTFFPFVLTFILIFDKSNGHEKIFFSYRIK